MNALNVIVLVTLTMFVCGVIAGYLAYIKNRDVSHWAAWGFIFPPSLLALLFLRKNQGPRPRRPTLDEEDRMHF